PRDGRLRCLAGPGGDRLAVPHGGRRRGAPLLGQLRGAPPRGARAGAPGGALPVRDLPPDVRGHADRPRLVEPAPLRARGHARAGRLTPMARPTGAPREKPQQIADELRRLIISGELDEGDSLGHEPELIARFGVSRPSLREALRILEAE